MKKMLGVVASALFSIATFDISAVTGFSAYQPKVPETLKK